MKLERPLLSRAELLGMRLPRLLGVVPAQLKTGLTVKGDSVYLMHNPKAAGTTLKEIFGIRHHKTLHIWASGAFGRARWRRSFVICAVRHPVERFLSGYRYHVLSPYSGYLFRIHGRDLKNIGIEEYFDLIRLYPDYLGPQNLWYEYPDEAKPHCDLVLKVEDSREWPDMLADRGIEIKNDLPELNKSEIPTFTSGICGGLQRKLHKLYEKDFDVLQYR